MEVREIMTKDPACCTPNTNLQQVAKMFVEHDCGCIPVVDSEKGMKPVGVITDRDICCRIIAEGKNPLELTAQDCMSGNVVTVTPEMNVDACCRVMEDNKVRRLPVVDADGRCCGVVAQADIAQFASSNKTAEVVKEVSKQTAATTGSTV